MVELIVVVGVIAGIMAMIGGIMINTYKANNKTIMMQAVDENGSWAIEKIRQYVLSNSGATIECRNDAGIGQILIKDAENGTGVYCRWDDVETHLGSILSVDEELTKSNEVMVNCDTFGIACDEASGLVTGIGVSFYIFAGDTNSVSSYVGKIFNTKITLRN
mgnify:CR=1 FL=1